MFGEEPKILASFGKDTAENYQEGLLTVQKIPSGRAAGSGQRGKSDYKYVL